METFFTDVPLIDDVDGGWSDWTVWSACSRDCGGGYRWRQRECNNPKPLGHGQECHGHPMEGQECHTHSCKGCIYNYKTSRIKLNRKSVNK